MAFWDLMHDLSKFFGSVNWPKLFDRLFKLALYAAVLLSLTGLAAVYSQDYTAEYHMAKALPLAITLGASLIAGAFCRRP